MGQTSLRHLGIRNLGNTARVKHFLGELVFWKGETDTERLLAVKSTAEEIQ